MILTSQPKNSPRGSAALGVIDACGGNITSLTEALWRLEVPFVVSSQPQELRDVDRLILPGVGAALETMDRLKKAGLVEFLQTWTRPLLGICIGMQILFESSDEGRGPEPTHIASQDPETLGSPIPLLGLIPGRVTPLQPTAQTRVPHMGWNRVDWLAPALSSAGSHEDFYFVHSYRVPDGPWVVGVTDHGAQIPAAIQWKNLYGVQFHPEKSQEAGLTIIRNFLKS